MEFGVFRTSRTVKNREVPVRRGSTVISPMMLIYLVR